jgi:hypothetical protein
MLYNRVVSLVIGTEGGQGREVSNLRCAFSIEKGSTKSPNKCTARVWNASPATRAQIEVIGNVLVLKAGYTEESGAALIFAGNIIRTLTVREGADWITELEMQDGFLEFRDTKISLSFAKGVTTQQVVDNISKQFGLPVRPLPASIAAKQYPGGFAFVGRVRDAMDKVCENSGLEWSIQNREIQVIPKGGVFKQRAYVLSPASGLLGSPSQESRTMTEKAAAKEGITSKQPGVRVILKRDKVDGEPKRNLQVFGFKVKSLLQPLIEPGSYVQLKSKGVAGEFFRVETLTHNGDTHGNEWHTELLLRYPKDG